jgi:hypothetical protein
MNNRKPSPFYPFRDMMFRMLCGHHFIADLAALFFKKKPNFSQEKVDVMQ